MTPEQKEIHEAEARRQERARQVNPIKQPSIAGPISERLFAALRAGTDIPEPAADDWREKAEAQRHEAAVTSIKRHWAAPLRHLQERDIERTGPRGEPWATVESNLIAKLGTGFLVALVGIRGPGKTQMGVELMKRSAEAERSCLYATAMGFFIAIKSTYGKKAESEEDVLSRYARPSLLVIDEAGRRGETDWEDRLLFELIDRRYREMRDTLLISNQGPGEFQTAIGPSLASRMVETGGIIECTWASFRI
jgi:hypothetical protein